MVSHADVPRLVTRKGRNESAKSVSCHVTVDFTVNTDYSSPNGIKVKITDYPPILLLSGGTIRVIVKWIV